MGVLQALKDLGFQCYDPRAADTSFTVAEPEDSRPVYRVFERPAPRLEQIEVAERPTPRATLFRYFLDGSMRTTGAGHVVDTSQRFLPIFISQVGVAVTELRGTKLSIATFKAKNILFMPQTFSDEDTRSARSRVKSTAKNSRQPLDLDLECYPVDADTKPIDGARKKVLAAMHDLEVGCVADLARSGRVTRDALLMIDGSLQFYRNLEQNREAFRNVVGVAKSFDVHKALGRGRNVKQVGTLAAQLRCQHRTPARRISHRNLTIGSWYLRIHDARPHAGISATDGVVKLEAFPEDATGSSPVLDKDRCDIISENVLSLRHPITPWTDARWSSHLYPIHLTERYIKARFRDERAMRACL